MKRSGIPVDVGKHKNPMKDVLLCKGGNAAKGETACIFHSEENSSTLQWYDLDMKPITTMDIPKPTKKKRERPVLGTLEKSGKKIQWEILSILIDVSF